ncbi:MAG: CAP domain-containing protein [Myxococcales bacterium]
MLRTTKLVWLLGLGVLGCGESPFASAGTGSIVGDPRFEADCSNGALDTPVSDCRPEPLQPTGDPYADCVTRINQLRWECQCLPPLERWGEAERCADQQAEYDSTRAPHSGFRDGICSPRGWAQNECPGWQSTEQVVTGCLQDMWDEGPGEPYSAHGHYINMTNPGYARVACGFYQTPDGRLWSVQNFE